MTIHESISIDAAPECVWALVGDPGRIAAWVLALEVSALSGSERWSRAACGAEVRERILEHAEAERYWIAEVIEPPPPLIVCRTVISVFGERTRSQSAGWQASRCITKPSCARWRRPWPESFATGWTPSACRGRTPSARARALLGGRGGSPGLALLGGPRVTY